MIRLSEGASASLRIEQLVDIDGFAKMCDLKPATLHAHRKRPDIYQIPDPVAWFGNVPVWTRRQIRDWMVLRRRTQVGQGHRTDIQRRQTDLKG